MKTAVMIKVEAIRPDPGQPRELKPEDKIAEMSAAFIANGFDAHITVRPDPECDVPIKFKNVTQANIDKWLEAGGRFMIIKGECRWTSFSTNPELLDKYDGCISAFVDMRERDAKTIYLDQIAENTNRIQMQPMEVVRSYGRSIELGATLEEVAKTFGKQPGYIQRELDLLKLPRFIQNAVDKGDLPKTVAHEIAKEPTDARMGKAFKQAMKGKGATQMLAKLEKWRNQNAQKTINDVLGIDEDVNNSDIKDAGKSIDKLLKAVSVFSKNAGDKGGLIIKARSREINKLEAMADEMIKQANMIKQNAKLYREYTNQAAA